MLPGKSWLKRLLSDDRRRAGRHARLPLSVYYWDGSVPLPRTVRDISREGMYLLTEQRWYPNTLVTMTLVRSDKSEGDSQRSITVTTRVVRSGADGVGLSFVMPNPNKQADAADSFSLGAGRKMLTEFLARLQADTGRKILQVAFLTPVLARAAAAACDGIIGRTGQHPLSICVRGLH